MMRRVGWSTVVWAASVMGAAVAQTATPSGKPAPSSESVYVERLSLTDVADQAGPGLNVGAVVASAEYAAGLQKAADIWGINLDLFVETSFDQRRRLVARLVDGAESAVIVEALHGEQWYPIMMDAASRGVGVRIYGPQARPLGFRDGWDSFKAARAGLLSRIPKYDEVLPIAFPLSPLPDNFFQPSGIAYPRPILRVPRTQESVSAIAPFQTACGVVEQTGNMLHPGSATETDIFTMGVEGGGMSLKALAGAVSPEKLAAVATAQVIVIRGEGGRQREILVENDAMASSPFSPAIHAPEELESLLAAWVRERKIAGFSQLSADEMLLRGWDGRDRQMRAALFLIPSDSVGAGELVAGRDSAGRKTFDFRSKDGLWQQFGEVGSTRRDSSPQPAAGGLPTVRGANSGATVGVTLRSLLKPLGAGAGHPHSYILSVEGGFFVVGAEHEISGQQLASTVRSLSVDIRGPLSSDQTITIGFEGNVALVLRRAMLDVVALDGALGTLKGQGLVHDWRYEGVRGRGLSANVVLLDFLGKHRRFMSSLAVTPVRERPSQGGLRFYVDGVQRLSFSLVTKDGWRQDFVEVPMRLPPVPRDIELYAGTPGQD